MPRIVRAHDLSQKPRTEDVDTGEDVEFSSLMLSPAVAEGLKRVGFRKPSPIQLKAIPLAKAKSGTGKTCVFAVALLENVDVTVPAIQGLVLAPTREIAVQIRDTISSIGKPMKGLVCRAFIGGLSVVDDIKHAQGTHIVIGTPGRIKALLETNSLPCDRVRLFVLDEADKLLERKLRDQINYIYAMLPERKQMLALSATYPAALAEALSEYMRDPIHVRIDADNPSLHGVQQHYTVVQGVDSETMPHEVFSAKSHLLLEVLKAFPFRQCMVFSNFRDRAELLAEALSGEGWPCSYISGAQGQEERLGAMAQLYAFKLRVLVSTDLTSRGIDLEAVDLVINMDLPYDAETYLHRIGRSGRFGAQGTAVSIVTSQELPQLRKIWAKYQADAIEWLPPITAAEIAPPPPNQIHPNPGPAAIDQSTENFQGQGLEGMTSPPTNGSMELRPISFNGTTSRVTSNDDSALTSKGLVETRGHDQMMSSLANQGTGIAVSALSDVTDSQLEALLAQSLPPTTSALSVTAKPFVPIVARDDVIEAPSQLDTANCTISFVNERADEPAGFRLPDLASLDLASTQAQCGDDTDTDLSVLSDHYLDAMPYDDQSEATEDMGSSQSGWAEIHDYYITNHGLDCQVCRDHYARYGIRL